MRRTTLTAAALLAVTGLVGCSTGGPAGEETAPDSPTGSATTEAPDAGGASSTEAGSEVAAAVTVGEHPYVWPCRLLTPTDAVDLFPLTEEADFSELGRGLSVGEAEMAEMKGTASGQRISSSCTYDFGDPAGTQATLAIDQFRTEEQAAAQWSTSKEFGDGKLPPRSADGSPFSEAEQAMVDIIKDGQQSLGGVRLPGLDDRILWRVGTNQFVATTGSMLLTFTRKRDSGFTDDLGEKDVKLAERAPGGAVARQLVRALRRRQRPHGRGPRAVVAPEDEPEEVLDSHLSNLVFSDPTVRPGRVRTIRAGLAAGGLYDVDASYLLVTQQGDAHYFALLDRYVIELEARQVATGRKKSPGGLPDFESVDTYTLKTGMEVVVENALATLGSSG